MKVKLLGNTKSISKWFAFTFVNKHSYKGLYCSGCECFLNPKDLTQDGLCPDHLKKPELVKEENYFFSFSENTHSKIFLFVEAIENTNIEFNILDNASLKLVIFSNGLERNLNFTFNLSENSSLDMYTSDIFSRNTSLVKTINLNGINAYSKTYEYIASNNNKIVGGFYVFHNAPSTKAVGKFIYLSKNKGIIDRNVESCIKKGMKDSDSIESIKGVILSSDAKIFAKPVLKVDFDDVKASHGCAIGTIDQNEIYYLMSRGLSREDAFKIICHSLINPILDEVKSSEEFLSLITPFLEESIGV